MEFVFLISTCIYFGLYRLSFGILMLNIILLGSEMFQNFGMFRFSHKMAAKLLESNFLLYFSLVLAIVAKRVD